MKYFKQNNACERQKMGLMSNSGLASASIYNIVASASA